MAFRDTESRSLSAETGCVPKHAYADSLLVDPHAIDLRLLRYFVAVAETEHIGKAARLLHISQSPLSRQIRQLEETTGLLLFERDRQRLRISSHGTWLLGRARQVLANVATLARDASSLARGETGTLRVGFVKTAMWSAVLPHALRLFRSHHPNVAIELKNARPAAQVAAILRGDLDVGLVHDAPATPGLAYVTLKTEPLCLVVPAGHVLSSKERVMPADLDGADWIALRSGRREKTPHATLLTACRKRGFVPNVCFTASDQDTVLGMVAAGMGSAFLPESVGETRRHGIALRTLPWLKISRALGAITVAKDLLPVPAEFLACLRTVTSAE